MRSPSHSGSWKAFEKKCLNTHVPSDTSGTRLRDGEGPRDSEGGKEHIRWVSTFRRGTLGLQAILEDGGMLLTEWSWLKSSFRRRSTQSGFISCLAVTAGLVVIHLHIVVSRKLYFYKILNFFFHTQKHMLHPYWSRGDCFRELWELFHSFFRFLLSAPELWGSSVSTQLCILCKNVFFHPQIITSLCLFWYIDSL